MAYGFEIYDQRGTLDDSSIGLTTLGTKTFQGTGNFKFTFPLENPPDFVEAYFSEITDAPTSDTQEPVYHLNVIPDFTNTSSSVVESTSGVCLIDGNIDENYTTESACITAGGTWDAEHPYFAVFSGTVGYYQVAKWENDGCLSTGTYANLKSNTEISLWFFSVGLI